VALGIFIDNLRGRRSYFSSFLFLIGESFVHRKEGIWLLMKNYRKC